jgi:hypothetical protein
LLKAVLSTKRSKCLLFVLGVEDVRIRGNSYFVKDEARKYRTLRISRSFVLQQSILLRVDVI